MYKGEKRYFNRTDIFILISGAAGWRGGINSHPVKYIPLTHIFTNYVRLITNFGLPLKAEGFCIHEIKVYIY